MGLEYYSPKSIPPEIQVYDSEIDQLGVGKAGKLGGIILRLELDNETRRTSIKDQFSKVPLYTQRALYLEEALPSMAYVFIVSPSGGILQGDRYRMDICLKNKALAHLTTQAATRVYKMEKNFATQIINIHVDEGCYLEYVPEQIIPYKNSRFYQVGSFQVHDRGTLVYSEIVTPGRVASGEHFEYDICYLKNVASNQQNKLRFQDVAILEPKKQEVTSFGVLENYDIFGTVYILTETKLVPQLCDEINCLLQNPSRIQGGSSILPNTSGLIVRLLGNTSTELREAIFEIVRIVRKHVLNAPFSGVRK